MKKPTGFKKLMHEKITNKGAAEKYCIENGYPKYIRTKK